MDKQHRFTWVFFPDCERYSTGFKSPSAKWADGAMFGEVAAVSPDICEAGYNAEATFLIGVEPTNAIPWDQRHVEKHFWHLSEACAWVEEQLTNLKKEFET